MATNRRLAAANSVCLALQVIEGQAPNTFFTIVVSDELRPDVVYDPADLIAKINGVPASIVQMTATSAVDMLIELDTPLAAGQVSLTVPPFSNAIRGKTGGYICQGTYTGFVV